MKNNKKNNKKALILIICFFILGLSIFLFFSNKTQKQSLMCEKIESNEQAKLLNKILINKKGKKIHINYNGTLEFFIKNEFTQSVLSAYIKNQVSEFKKNDDDNATYEESENKISYEFNFDINSQIENEIKELIGIYSEDIKELKKHFESGGAICEEI